MNDRTRAAAGAKTTKALFEWGKPLLDEYIQVLNVCISKPKRNTVAKVGPPLGVGERASEDNNLTVIDAVQKAMLGDVQTVKQSQISFLITNFYTFIIYKKTLKIPYTYMYLLYILHKIFINIHIIYVYIYMFNSLYTYVQSSHSHCVHTGSRNRAECN
jgi:hypothetical protein